MTAAGGAGPAPTEVPAISFGDVHFLPRRCEAKPGGKNGSMLFDILVAVVIVVIAAILGLVVHPVLWVIVIAAVLWLVGRNRYARR